MGVVAFVATAICAKWVPVSARLHCVTADKDVNAGKRKRVEWLSKLSGRARKNDRTIERWNEGVGVGGGDAKTRNPNWSRRSGFRIPIE